MNSVPRQDASIVACIQLVGQNDHCLWTKLVIKEKEPLPEQTTVYGHSAQRGSHDSGNRLLATGLSEESRSFLRLEISVEVGRA
jgi:hypothetical protein